MSIAAAGALCLVLLQSPSDEAVRQAAKSELVDRAYQTRLPGDEPAAEGQTRRRDASPRRPRRRVDAPPMDVPGPLARIANALIWVLAIATGAVLLIWVLRELLGFAPPPRPTAAAPAAEAAAMRAVVARPLRDAEALAAQGLFGEAIHILLLRTLEALVQRRGLDLPASLTSREVVAHVELPAEADAALRGLVAAVEVSHFGGLAPGHEQWQICLAQFHRFADALGGSR